jgi:hypothetical protein
VLESVAALQRYRLSGIFYTPPEKSRLIRYRKGGAGMFHNQLPPLALPS